MTFDFWDCLMIFGLIVIALVMLGAMGGPFKDD